MQKSALQDSMQFSIYRGGIDKKSRDRTALTHKKRKRRKLFAHDFFGCDFNVFRFDGFASSVHRKI